MEIRELLLAYCEIRFDRIHLRYRSEHGTRSNQASDLHLRDAGDSSDERRNFGELHVEFSLFDIRFSRQNQRLRTELRLDFRIKLALRDGSRLR